MKLNWSDPSPLNPERTIQDEVMCLVRIFNSRGLKVLGFVVDPAAPAQVQQFGNFEPRDVTPMLLRALARGMENPETRVDVKARIPGGKN
jgi:hypothetical protein